MRETATVMRVDGKLVAEVIRPEACKKCRSCELGREERFYLPVPGDGANYREGDLVMITLPDGKVGVASLIAYGIPLAMFLIGLIIGDAVFHTERAQIIMAVALLVVGFLALKLIDRPLREKKTFTPTMRQCMHVDGRAEDEEE